MMTFAQKMSFCRRKKTVEYLEPAIKDKRFFLANAVIRDANTKKGYTH